MSIRFATLILLFFTSLHVSISAAQSSNLVPPVPTENWDARPSTSAKLSLNNPDGPLNEEAFAGPTVAERVNAAVSSCGSSLCTITIPSYANKGTGWKTPVPFNVVVQDLRYFNGIGFANSQHGIGGPHLFSAFNLQTVAADNQPWDKVADGSGAFTMDLEAHATGGGYVRDGARANSGALLLFSDRQAGSNRPNWGADVNVQYANLNNQTRGIEIDLVNAGNTDDPGDGTVGVGEQIIASGNAGTKAGVGLMINGSNTTFQTDAILTSYSKIGLHLASSAAKTADIAISSSDESPTIPAIILTSSSLANAQFTLFDDGSLRGNKISATSLTAKNGFTGTKKAGSCVLTIQSGIITNVTGC